MKKFSINEFNPNLSTPNHSKKTTVEVLDFFKDTLGNETEDNSYDFTKELLNKNYDSKPFDFSMDDIDFEMSEENIKTSLILKFLDELRNNENVNKIELLMLYLMELKLRNIQFDDDEFSNLEKFLKEGIK